MELMGLWLRSAPLSSGANCADGASKSVDHSISGGRKLLDQMTAFLRTGNWGTRIYRQRARMFACSGANLSAHFVSGTPIRVPRMLELLVLRRTSPPKVHACLHAGLKTNPPCSGLMNTQTCMVEPLCTPDKE